MTGEPSGTCSVCHRRDPREGRVCEGCRSRLAGWLAELPHLYADLLARDDVLRSEGGHGHVSGTHDAPVPIRVDAVDLTLPARGSVSDTGHDQVGHLPTASVLAAWADDWRTARNQREGRPDPQVRVLCRWLGDRLDWATAHHPAISDFATELGDVRRALYGVLGLFDIPDYKRGVPCRSPACEALHLVQQNGSPYVECLSCGRLYTQGEYTEWTQTMATFMKGRRIA